MRTYHYTIFFITFLFCSCNNTAPTTESDTQVPIVADTIVAVTTVLDTIQQDTVVVEKDTIKDVPVIKKPIKQPVMRKASHWQTLLNSRTSVKVFKGMIDDIPIEMVLMFEEDNHLNGFYLYNKYEGQALRLNGSMKNETVLYEWDDHFNNTGIFSGKLNEKMGTYEGIWEDSSGTKKMPFVLEQITPKRPTTNEIKGVYTYEINIGDADSENPNGTATITTSGDHYNMILDVFVSGHTGELDSDFRLDRLAGDIMRTNYETSSPQDCLMDIILYKDVLYIEERDCMQYHGDRATFWGLYFKE